MSSSSGVGFTVPSSIILAEVDNRIDTHDTQFLLLQQEIVNQDNLVSDM
jgi:hypothetical protein